MKQSLLVRRIIMILAVLCLFCFDGFSQGNPRAARFNLGADLVSRYVWRGRDYGNSPAIQPNVSFSVAGFKAGMWGSMAFVPQDRKINDSTTVSLGNYAETDPYLAYEIKGITLQVTDFFCPNPLTPNENNAYFNYKNSTTGHTFEISISYAGPEKFPIQLVAGTMVYGADKDQDSSGVWGAGTDNNFSTYLEAAYTFQIKSIGVKPFIGGIPFGSSWYGPYGGIVNLGVTVSKTVKITGDYSLPLYTSIITNPQSQSIFFVFGLSL
jgi:hypothetical protein